MQQVVHGAQLPSNAKLVFQDPLNVFATQAANLIFHGGAGRQSGFELRLLLGRERARSPPSRVIG